MDIADIPEWVAQQRAAAKTQAERWQGVDPSRLLEALDLVEQLLQPSAAAAPAGVPLIVMEVKHAPFSTWSPGSSIALIVQINAMIDSKDAPTIDAQIRLLHELSHMGQMLVTRRNRP
jgi:hypothetical protein